MPEGYQMLSFTVPTAWSLLLLKLKGANMKREYIFQGLSICAVLILVILSFGCATTNFATSNTTTKIQGRMDRKTLTTWDKYYPWKISNSWIGRDANTRSEYRIDAGKQKIQVAYIGNRGSWRILRYAGPVELEVDLAPNATYKIDGESFDKQVYFIIIDRGTGTEVLRYGPVDVVLRPIPEARVTYRPFFFNFPPLFVK